MKSSLSSRLLIGMCVLPLGLVAGPAQASPSTGGITGQWLIERADKPGFISLTIQRRRDHGGGHMSSGDDTPASIVRGLDWKQADSAAGATVRFQIARDAGTFQCEGWFRSGKGSGHFTFAPAASFAADMRALGYGDLSQEQMFTLAVHDVSRALIRDYARLGYPRIELDKLVAMRIHRVTPAYIRELAALGYSKVDVDKLVAMRIHGVSPAEIRKLRALGYPRLDTDKLVAFRIHGVSPEFVEDVRAEGYRGVPADKLVAMRIHGVSPDFIQRLKKRGYARLSVDELISLKIHGVAR
ncbi:MAG TPA: hypothetical protein VNO33_00820 [Kofleriaceae bacterium]|nr:hypothetical protein [Kofleriaceae bacterium]